MCTKLSELGSDDLGWSPQHISHNTSHRRNLATCRPPRNLSCNTSQYLAASRSPFRILSQPLVPEGWTFGRRDTNFGGSSTSHHTTPHLPQRFAQRHVPTKHGRGIASSHRTRQWCSWPLAIGPAPVIETQRSQTSNLQTRGNVEPSDAARVIHTTSHHSKSHHITNSRSHR